MAKKSKVIKNEKRRKMVKQYAAKRAELKEILASQKTSPEEKEAAGKKLRKLPRDSSRTRIRNRCELTGRPRAFYRKFGLSRLALRDRAMKGELPGVTKSSW
ncbi:MAG: 30S ribosomal protein S14 [Bdellovibrionota bacterium]